jgi:hypothetical protein
LPLLSSSSPGDVDVEGTSAVVLAVLGVVAAVAVGTVGGAVAVVEVVDVGVVVDVVDVVADDVVDDVAAGSVGATGFSHTDDGLADPIDGKRLSLIALATPTIPMVASSAMAPPTINPRQPEVQLGVTCASARPSSVPDDESTGVSSTPSMSWPCCSQSSLTAPVWPVRLEVASDNGRSTSGRRRARSS